MRKGSDKMRGTNKYEIIDAPKKNGMKVSRGDRSIEMSPEVSMQICKQMTDLGTKLISEVGGITVGYFKTQADMYYGELNTYIKNQTIKSDERKIILAQFEKLANEYSDLIKQTENKEKREELFDVYKRLSDTQSEFYLNALRNDNGGNERPEKPNLLKGIKSLFSRK